MKDLTAMKIARCFLCAITLALLFLISPTGHAQGNLLVNNGWTGSPSPGGNIIAGSGTTNFSVAFIYNGGSISQTFATTPGTTYLLSFQAIEFQGTNYCGVNAGSLAATLNFAGTVPIQYDDGLGGLYANAGPNLNNTVWENFSYTFVASANTSSTTLSFVYYPQEIQVTHPTSSPDYYWGAGGVQNISVTLAPVPEPSTIALLGLGLAGVAYFRRSHFKN